MINTQLLLLLLLTIITNIIFDCAQVVDRETITGLPGGAAAECLAVYHVDAAGLIARVQAKQIIIMNNE